MQKKWATGEFLLETEKTGSDGKLVSNSHE